MKNIDLLSSSLNYIEANLCENISTGAIARKCACSRSTLEKLFRYVYSLSVHDYIVRRRMMKAAEMLSSDPKATVLDVAVECGYSSNEAFTRAFRKVWNENPSSFRGRQHSELSPKFTAPILQGDEYIMTRKSYDITQLYDLFRERQDCWFVCSDIKALIPINNISNKAGDLAIITALERMNSAAGENDIAFRIGGDEFCMLTASSDETYADEIIRKIEALNGETFSFEGRDIPLSLFVTKTKASLRTPKYDELFTELHNAIKNCK